MTCLVPYAIVLVRPDLPLLGRMILHLVGLHRPLPSMPARMMRLGASGAVMVVHPTTASSPWCGPA